MPAIQTDLQSLRVESDGIVARIVLRRPPLNILDLGMIRELSRTVEDLRSDPGLRVVVLCAEGKAFSAGVAVEEHLPGKVEAALGAFHEVFRQLRALSRPTIAAVQGAALGGGCELACFADIVIASEVASFGQPEVKLGVFPPLAAVHFPRRIGQARTLQLLYSGDLLTAHEAQRIGLVDHVVAPEDLESSVKAAVAALREKSATALGLLKRAVLMAEGLDFEVALGAVEDLYLHDLMRTPDATEGLRAFLEKRHPRWS